jgi:hypothetical protein
MPMTERETTARHRPYLHFSVNGSAPHQSEPNSDAPDRKGLFGPLIDALHDSRHRQASRAIHQYRHLIAAPRSVKTDCSQPASNIFEQPKGRIKMTTSDDANGRRNGHSTKVLTWTLIAACIIGFGILHIAGGAIINGAVKPPAEMPPVQLTGD